MNIWSSASHSYTRTWTSLATPRRAPRRDATDALDTWMCVDTLCSVVCCVRSSGVRFVVLVYKYIHCTSSTYIYNRMLSAVNDDGWWNGNSGISMQYLSFLRRTIEQALDGARERSASVRRERGSLEFVFRHSSYSGVQVTTRCPHRIPATHSTACL